MSSLGQKTEAELLEYLSGQKKASELSLGTITTWVSLAVEAPTSATTNATAKEAKYTGAKRVEVKGTEWEKPVEGTPTEISNKNEVKWPESSGGEASKVGWFIVWSAETGERMLGWGALGSEKTVEKESTPNMAAKTLKWTMS
jgi:hypothetical protein